MSNHFVAAAIAKRLLHLIQKSSEIKIIMYDYRLANTKIYFFLREKAKHPNFMVCYMLILLDQTTHPKKFYIKYIKYPLKKIW